jgi:histidinol-phosphatase (PHP family)
MGVFLDYHVHTDNSFDCKVPMAEMCAAALRAGVSEIAFTDHFNNHLMDIDLGYYDPERYFANVEQCRAQFPNLMIRTGIEVGEPHRWGRKILPVLERYPYDVVLGSLHWIGNHNMFDPNYFRAYPQSRAFGNYFAELVEMIRHGGFDILAHVDLPKRVGFDVYGDFDICQHEDRMRAIWQACIENDITPEINTKGIRCSVAELHPTLDALRWYAEMGGRRLTLGSDAHHPNNVGDNFGMARHTASESGLTHVCRFERRQIVGWHPL